jgi:Flp pilus assembly protein CpaB
MSEAREQALLEEIEALRGENATLAGSASKSFGTRVIKALAKVFVGIAVALGLFVVAIVAEQPADIPPSRPVRMVPMALVELEPGMIIREGDVGLGPYPADLLVGDILLAEEVIVGRLVTEPIQLTDLFHASKLGRVPDAPPTDD